MPLSSVLSKNKIQTLLWTLRVTAIGLPWLDFGTPKEERVRPRLKQFIEEELHKNEEFVQKDIIVDLSLLPPEFGFNYAVGKPTSFLFQNKYILHVPRTLVHRLEVYDQNARVMRSFQETNFFPLNEEILLIDRFCISHEVGHMIHHDPIKIRSLASVAIGVYFWKRYITLAIGSVFGLRAFQRHLEKEADQYSIQFFTFHEKVKIAQWLMRNEDNANSRRSSWSVLNFVLDTLRSHPSPSARAKDILKYNPQDSKKIQ